MRLHWNSESLSEQEGSIGTMRLHQNNKALWEQQGSIGTISSIGTMWLHHNTVPIQHLSKTNSLVNVVNDWNELVIKIIFKLICTNLFLLGIRLLYLIQVWVWYFVILVFNPLCKSRIQDPCYITSLPKKKTFSRQLVCSTQINVMKQINPLLPKQDRNYVNESRF